MTEPADVTPIATELDAHPDLSAEKRRSVGLWLRLMKATMSLQRGMETRLRQNHNHGLSRFDVMSQLERGPDPWLSVGELAGRLLASSGNISRLLDRMDKEGLIRRRRSDQDRRRQEISLSAAGRRLFREMAEDHAEWIHGVLGELGASDQNELILQLDRVRKIIAAAEARDDALRQSA